MYASLPQLTMGIVQNRIHDVHSWHMPSWGQEEDWSFTPKGTQCIQTMPTPQGSIQHVHIPGLRLNM